MSALINPHWYAVVGPATDPFFANVVLLLHLDGAHGSTSYPDSSPAPHSMSNLGASLTTAQFRFGTASLQNSVGGSIFSSDHVHWDFGAGQFTVEAFIRPTSTVSGLRGIVTQWAGASDLSWGLAFNGGNLCFNYSTTGANLLVVSGAYAPPLNTWVHLAADRDASNMLRVYADGVVIASATVAATFFNSTRSMQIANDENGTRHFIGQIDEVRITKGVARYAGAFAPPTAAFPNA